MKSCRVLPAPSPGTAPSPHLHEWAEGHRSPAGSLVEVEHPHTLERRKRPAGEGRPLVSLPKKILSNGNLCFYKIVFHLGYSRK